MPSATTKEVCSLLQKIKEGFLVVESIGFEVCCLILDDSDSKGDDSTAFDSISSEFRDRLDSLKQDFEKLNESYFATSKHHYKIQHDQLLSQMIQQGPSSEKFREELQVISERMKVLTDYILQFVPKKSRKKILEPSHDESEVEASKRPRLNDDGTANDECGDNDSVASSAEAVMGEDEVPSECPTMVFAEFEDSVPVRVKLESEGSLDYVLAAAKKLLMKKEHKVKIERATVIKCEPMDLVPAALEEHSTSMTTEMETTTDSCEQETSDIIEDGGGLNAEGATGPSNNTVEQLSMTMSPGRSGAYSCSYYI